MRMDESIWQCKCLPMSERVNSRILVNHLLVNVPWMYSATIITIQSVFPEILAVSGRRVILPRRKLQINSKFLVDSWVNGCDSQKYYFFLITLKPNIRYWWDFLPNLKNLEYEFSTERTKLWPIHIKIKKRARVSKIGDRKSWVRNSCLDCQGG